MTEDAPRIFTAMAALGVIVVALTAILVIGMVRDIWESLRD